MNLERKTEKNIDVKEKQICTVEISELILEKQLGQEYLDSGIFINPEIGSELKEKAIPFLLEILDKSNPDNRENALGGTIMEIATKRLSKEEYWQQKKQLKEDVNALLEYKISGERENLFTEAMNELSNGDPDMDQYETNVFYLKERSKLIFEMFEKEAQPSEKIIGGQELNISASENINLDIYFGPVYNGSQKYRLCLQLKDKSGNKLYHVDITATPETAIEGTVDERSITGTVQDNCRGKIKNGIVEYNPNEIPKAEDSSTVRINEKASKKILVPTFREVRKKESHKVSINNNNRDNFSINNFCQLLDMETIFKLREFGYRNGKKLKSMYEKQTPEQKKMIMKEMLLILSINPILGVKFLVDTGFDVLAFGRHLTKKEEKLILSSKHLNFFLSYGQEEKFKSEDEKIEVFYKRLLGLKKGYEKSTLLGLFGAIGEVLIPNKQKYNEDSHDQIQNGLNIFINPERIPKLPKIELKNALGSDEKEILRVLINNGGMTRKGIQGLLRKENFEKWASISDFDASFKKLVMSGTIEADTKIGYFNNKKKEVRIYGACVSNARIEQILFDAGKEKLKNKIVEKIYKSAGIESIETATSLTKKELLQSGILGQIVYILNPFILSYLLEIQRKIEERPMTHSNIDLL